MTCARGARQDDRTRPRRRRPARPALRAAGARADRDVGEDRACSTVDMGRHRSAVVPLSAELLPPSCDLHELFPQLAPIAIAGRRRSAPPSATRRPARWLATCAAKDRAADAAPPPLRRRRLTAYRTCTAPRLPAPGDDALSRPGRTTTAVSSAREQRRAQSRGGPSSSARRGGRPRPAPSVAGARGAYRVWVRHGVSRIAAARLARRHLHDAGVGPLSATPPALSRTNLGGRHPVSSAVHVGNTLGGPSVADEPPHSRRRASSKDVHGDLGGNRRPECAQRVRSRRCLLARNVPPLIAIDRLSPFLVLVPRPPRTTSQPRGGSPATTVGLRTGAARSWAALQIGAIQPERQPPRAPATTSR